MTKNKRTLDERINDLNRIIENFSAMHTNSDNYASETRLMVYVIQNKENDRKKMLKSVGIAVTFLLSAIGIFYIVGIVLS